MCSIDDLDGWAALVDALPDPDPRLGAGLAGPVVALRRLAERAHVRYLAYLAALDRSCAGVVGGEHTAGFVAAQARLPIRVVGRELHLARSLYTDRERPCEATRDALVAGRLTTPQADAIARTIQKLPPEDVQATELALAAACVDAAPSATDQLARRALFLPGSMPAARREARAHAVRHLSVTPRGEMVAIDGLLPSSDGAFVIAALDPLAQPTAADRQPDATGRSHPQRMADALVELARRQLNAGDLPTNGGVRPNVHITVDLVALLDRVDSAAIEGRSQGVVGLETVERHACDSLLDWSVTAGGAAETRGSPAGDPAAEVKPGRPPDPALLAQLVAHLAPALGGSSLVVLAAGRERRLVSAAQRKALIHRDHGCVYPGCDRTPEWCDAHHLDEWLHHSGGTDIDNLASC